MPNIVIIKGEMYLDAYKKMHNECIKIKED